MKHSSKSISSKSFPHTARIHKLARQLFTDDAAVTKWLSIPSSALEGKAPIDLLSNEAGAQKVEDLIVGILHGHLR